MSTLSYLASFHSVSQTLNISAAAKILGMTQPSLSRQLQRLEEQLGVSLFVRKQRGIALTADGEKLAEAVAPAMAALSQRLELIQNQSRSTKGHVRIGSLTEIGKTLVLPRILSFKNDFPDVEIELHLMRGSEIINALTAQEIDCGVIAEMPSQENLRISKLSEERSVLISRSSYSKDVATWGDVVSSRFIAYRPGDPLLAGFLSAKFPEMSVKRVQPQLTINDHKGMIDMILSGDYFAVMPVASIAGYLESGMVRIGCDFKYETAIWLARSKKSKDSIIVKGLMRHLTKTS